MRMAFIASLLLGTSVLASTDNLEPAVDYTADLVIEAAGKSITGKVFAAGKRSRMEFLESGHRAVMIVDRASQTLLMLNPQQKVAVELPMAGAAGQGIPQHPLEGSVELKKDGSETVEGFPCTRYLVVDKDRPALKSRAWISNPERIPLRIEGTDEQGRTFKWLFKNVKVGKLDATQFEAPKDYQRMNAGAMPGMDPAQMQKLREQLREHRQRNAPQH